MHFLVLGFVGFWWSSLHRNDPSMYMSQHAIMVWMNEWVTQLSTSRAMKGTAGTNVTLHTWYMLLHPKNGYHH